MKNSLKLSMCIALFGAGVIPQVALAQDKTNTSDGDVKNWRLSTGISYSTGDYGEIEKTTVISAPVSLRYKTGDFSLRVSVPWVQLDGTGSLISSPEGGDGGSGGGGRGRGRGGSGDDGGSGGVDVDNNDDIRQKVSGLGDVVVSATYTADFGGDFYADLNGKVKLPTASQSKRLGTGKVDFTTGVDLIKDIGDLSLYVGGRRTFRGSSIARPLENTWGAGAGISYSGDAASVGFDYDWQESSFAGRGASQDITAWTNFKLGGPLRLTLYAGTGLNVNSADFIGGATLSLRF